MPRPGSATQRTTATGPAAPATADAKLTSECRASAGVCDVAEVCDGVADDCPATPSSRRRPSAVPRRACATWPRCARARAPAVRRRLRAGDDGVPCFGRGLRRSGLLRRGERCLSADAKLTSECRASAGVCDAAEVCDGVADDCPADAVEPATTECRASAGACDAADYCDGVSGACDGGREAHERVPGLGGRLRRGRGLRRRRGRLSGRRLRAGDDRVPCLGGRVRRGRDVHGRGRQLSGDAFAPATTECRASAGVCDAADYCDGASAACTADAKLTSECRASAGVCDVAEVCDGVADDCPADAFAPATTECRASAGACDAADYCDGASAACAADAKLTSECRASAGVCDVAEVCDGVADDCPADAFEPATTECRASGGRVRRGRDVHGRGRQLSGDAFAPATTECRASAGVCDAADYCDGASAACTADAKLTSECRASAGVCDAAEVCDGVADDCPADAFAPATTECRASAGVCDAADYCDGASGSLCGGCEAHERVPGLGGRLRRGRGVRRRRGRLSGDASRRRRPSAVPRRACATWPRCARARAQLSGDAFEPATTECRARRGLRRSGLLRRGERRLHGGCEAHERVPGLGGRLRRGRGVRRRGGRLSGRRLRAGDDGVPCFGRGLRRRGLLRRGQRRLSGGCEAHERVPGLGGRLRRGRGVRRRADDCPATPRAGRPSAVPRRACATWPRCARARARLSGDAFAPATTECRASAGSATQRTTATGPAPPVRRMRSSRASAGPRRASATWPRCATAWRTTVRRTPSSRRRRSAVPRRGSATPRTTATGSAAPARRMRSSRASAGPRRASATWPRCATAWRTTVRRTPSSRRRPSAVASGGRLRRGRDCARARAQLSGDAFEPATTECRASAGVCDAADNCDGASAACGADAKLTSECRASAGACDAAEVCDGVADTVRPTLRAGTTECRAAAGVCDAPDDCDGASAPACPADAKLTTRVPALGTASATRPSSVTGCRTTVGGICPRTALPCPDGDLCNGNEICVGLDCTAGPPPVCDDDDICTSRQLRPAPGLHQRSEPGRGSPRKLRQARPSQRFAGRPAAAESAGGRRGGDVPGPAPALRSLRDRTRLLRAPWTLAVQGALASQGTDPAAHAK